MGGAFLRRGVLPDGLPYQAMLLFLIAVMFGGGGSGAGLSNLVVQLAACAALAFNRRTVVGFFAHAPRMWAALVGVTVLLPLMQTIPLPPGIWQHLPGRDLAAGALALLGKEQDWMPFSLNVRRTIVAVMALLPALAILVLTWNLAGKERRSLLLLVVVCGAFVVMLGAQQLAMGNRQFVLFAETYGSQDLHGTFANHNSAGLFIDIALCALVGLIPDRYPRLTWLLFGGVVGLLLAIGLFLTRSRSGIVLVGVPAIFLAVRLWHLRKAIGLSRRSVTILSVGAALLAGAGGLLVADNARIQRSISRFDDLKDARPAIWEDATGAIARFWPVGSGVGTFDEVFQVDESLENISPGRAARAHNDYLEIALESGVAGMLLVAAWFVGLIAVIVRVVRRGGSGMAPAAVFVLFALQSILDYPLRSQTLLCVAGLMLGLLIARSPGAGEREVKKVVKRREK
ncbi:O-antigen ligase family protein [Novosphingobium sp. BL-52-GroH]|uniref:O-antigen ligase family protein n=1 Tax=Novosphingobium sp. BL-52-GroH TaxID=3349877 RepID=UPI00384DE355